MNPSVLTVYKSPFKKLRLGKNYDGGYIMCEIPDIKYDILLSGGILNDISFEEAWLNKFPDIKCLAFDGTIKMCHSNNPNFTWLKKNISGVSNDLTTNLHDIINNNSSIFLKMDIEGWEIPWLESLTEEHMNKLSQIVIEFHNPFSHKENLIFEKINKTHKLLHFHANNCCGTRQHNGVIIPNIFECTYVHKKYLSDNISLNTDPIPSSIDQPNIPRNPEIRLMHKPFVNK